MHADPLRAAEISRSALAHNIARIRAITGTEVIVVVKADAYGHHAAIVAPAVIAAGATMVAVASLEEALALRASGVTAPVLCWLHGTGIDYHEAIRSRITLGITSAAQLDRLGAAATDIGRTAHAHLKLDTGLSRNGAAPEAWAELFRTAAQMTSTGAVRISGVFSHLANAGQAEDRAQAARFDAAVRQLRRGGVAVPLRHLAASAAALTSPHLRYDAVRIGLAAYGLSPGQGIDARALGLVPVMTLVSQIVSLRTVPAGTPVSGEPHGPCAHDRLLALVAIGYADGLPRAAGGAGTSVTVLGTRVPLVATIGMDTCLIDVTSLGRSVSPGTRVVLFGNPARGEPSVDEWADRLQTINYEILAGVGQRVTRLPVGEGGDGHASR